ncbi:transcriptional regulator GcvA [Lacibacterium aquatile]|uniref:Transcriptional regulator GcvA n=1 Tax=Lacibacterium aquatile TaxID=1168082 RepID=A0ABW5DX09_9PROT
MSEKRHRLPPLNALRAFDAAGRHLNFRIAAEELGVTQGAVAQQVRGLEAELGVKLFDRLPRTLALTVEGRSYLAGIGRAFELIGEATASLRPTLLQLTISVTPSFASKWLIPRLPDFTEAHPHLDLRIHASEGLSNFQSDAVDIAVRQGRPPFGTGLQADLLFEQEVIAVCSPLLLDTPVTLPAADELHRFALLHDAHNLWPEFIETALGSKAPMASKGVRFNQTALAIDAAVAGQGMALASRFLVEQDIKAGRLICPFSASLRGQFDFYILAPRKQRHVAATAKVREWLLGYR